MGNMVHLTRQGVSGTAQGQWVTLGRPTSLGFRSEFVILLLRPHPPADVRHVTHTFSEKLVSIFLPQCEFNFISHNLYQFLASNPERSSEICFFK